LLFLDDRRSSLAWVIELCVAGTISLAQITSTMRHNQITLFCFLLVCRSRFEKSDCAAGQYTKKENDSPIYALVLV
jgi:hypothetical protein